MPSPVRIFPTPCAAYLAGWTDGAGDRQSRASFAEYVDSHSSLRAYRHGYDHGREDRRMAIGFAAGAYRQPDDKKPDDFVPAPTKPCPCDGWCSNAVGGAWKNEATHCSYCGDALAPERAHQLCLPCGRAAEGGHTRRCRSVCQTLRLR